MIRVLTTLGLAVFVLIGIWYFPLFYIRCLILIAIGLGLFEYAHLKLKDRGSRIFTLLLGLSLASLMTWAPSQETLLGGLVGSLFLILLWGLKNKEPLNEAFSRVGLILFGVCYLGLTLPCWGWLFQFGREYVMLLLFPACLTDTFGFLIGKGMGRHKLAPVVSPHKTWEGFFAGLFGGVFGLGLAQRLFFQTPVMNTATLIFLGLTLSLLASLGDLFESLIKRSAGVKDSGNLIPGHGGVLDRLDALIFTAPAFYLLLNNKFL